MTKTIKPPESFTEALSTCKLSIFLAGSIEMGAAIDWQAQFIESFKDEDSLLFLNPRRDDWDSSWEQSIENKHFREQVEWELEAQEKADIIVIYFAPNTKSPITLLELGLFAKSKKMICCCPKGFWRKGNVDVVCDRYGVEVVDSLDKMISALREKIEAK
ncbi:hypothetical protein CTEN210_08185 [Chaetoceros tenuissimus]|uniref:Nucleoside 2-deoxyribosyltransferase like n=1 Tax=Chaetoceros tenuissimus TaxID=426638 RepID=A0AAD3H6G9_9STRA|nr:hypothetical protein CTEN210_08185 [Chaetoceros tenuissimus]